MTWEEKCRVQYYSYPIVKGLPTVPFDLSVVYPLQQRNVVAVYELLRCDPHIKGVTVFGSSVSQKCNINSDLDLLIDVGDIGWEYRTAISSQINQVVSTPIDIIWADRLPKNSELYRDILWRFLRII